MKALNLEDLEYLLCTVKERISFLSKEIENAKTVEYHLKSEIQVVKASDG